MGDEGFRKELSLCGMQIVWRGSSDYDEKRKICNSRFDLYPLVIAYCENNIHVECCIKTAIKYTKKIRIRSGGHQHEGMCSAEGVLIIDLSKINHIEYTNGEKTEAWIEPGIHLGNLYKELREYKRIIPGGGCANVCVGGLTQGGGWGPSLRKLGLTCDNILEVEIVNDKGNTIIANKEGNPELFWAIRGGGGGNFGVITKFLFKLTKVDEPVTIFSIHWSKEQMPEVLRTYITLLPEFTHNLTTFARLTVVNRDTSKRPSITVGGQYYGTIEEAEEILKPLLAIPKLAADFEYIDHFEAYQKFNKALSPFIQPAFSESKTALQQSFAEDAPTDTCSENPYPHKVSSAFPKGNTSVDYKELLDIIIKRFDSDEELSNQVNTYLSIHSMGGAVRNLPHEDSAFAFRDKEFLLQFQAWWSDPEDERSCEYICWIENFRKQISEYTEGAFINFPDRTLELSSYYANHFPKLIKVKTDYDPENVFSFEMSIPPK